MIDFRYHLVSLMAVLVALTLGIVLGAGPLQGTIAESISSQVSSLNKQQGDLQSKNEELAAEIKDKEAFLEAYNKTVLKGRLKDKKITVVVLPGVADKVVSAQKNALNSAGAEVLGVVQLTPKLNNDTEANFRSEFSAQLASKDESLKKVTNPLEIIGFGLGKMLTAPAEEADKFRGSLADPKVNILTVSNELNQAAEAIVVLGSLGETDNKKWASETVAAFLKGIGEGSANKVAVLGKTDSKEDFLAKVRESGFSGVTVDNADSPEGYATSVLAIEALLAGKTGNYGTGKDATALIPAL